MRLVVHIALFRWHPDATQEQIDHAMEGVRQLETAIPFINLLCGENFGPFSEGYTHAVVVTFKDRAALDAYRSNPAHKPVADEIDQLYSASVGFDFEV